MHSIPQGLQAEMRTQGAEGGGLGEDQRQSSIGGNLHGVAPRRLQQQPLQQHLEERCQQRLAVCACGGHLTVSADA